jgi:hypothetical protein
LAHANPRISCDVSSGTSSCGQWPTPSSSTQSACGSHSSRNRAAAAGHGSSASSVPQDDPHGAGDLLRVEAPALAQRVVDQGERRVAAGDAADLMGEQLRRDVLEPRGAELRRPAPALRRGDQRLGVESGAPRGLDQRPLDAERAAIRLVAARPAARRCERDDRPRAAARRELQRHVAAQRVAGEVRRLEARRVHRALDRVGEHGIADRSLDRRPAGVTGERRRQDVVPPLQRGQDELPAAPGVGEPVQAHERRPRAAAV